MGGARCVTRGAGEASVRRGGCVIAIVLAAALCAAHVTLAEPFPYEPIPGEPVPAEPEPDTTDAADDAQAQFLSMPPLSPEFADAARLLVFSSVDIWRQGGFAHGGALWAPAGLDRDGFVLKLMFGGGLYRLST